MFVEFQLELEARGVVVVRRTKLRASPGPLEQAVHASTFVILPKLELWRAIVGQSFSPQGPFEKIVYVRSRSLGGVTITCQRRRLNHRRIFMFL